MDFGTLLSLLYAMHIDPITGLLALIIGGLVYDRVRLLREASDRTKQVLDIVDKYQQNAAAMVEALNGLSGVLHEIKGRLS